MVTVDQIKEKLPTWPDEVIGCGANFGNQIEQGF
jgi:hypothetical protein